MRKELDEKLCADYPLIFVNRHADKRVSPMAWGFSCGDGWYNLINRLCRTIQSHINSTNEHRDWCIAYNARMNAALAGDWSLMEQHYPSSTREQLQSYVDRRDNWPIPDEVKQVVAVQVKEKFGGLRFYVDHGNDYVYGAIALAESMSFSICDRCGALGQVGNQSLTFEERIRDGYAGYYATRCKEHWGNNVDF